MRINLIEIRSADLGCSLSRSNGCQRWQLHQIVNGTTDGCCWIDCHNRSRSSRHSLSIALDCPSIACCTLAESMRRSLVSQSCVAWRQICCGCRPSADCVNRNLESHSDVVHVLETFRGRDLIVENGRRRIVPHGFQLIIFRCVYLFLPENLLDIRFAIQIRKSS